MDHNRRKLIKSLGIASLTLAAAPKVLAAAPICFDPAALPLSQKNRRRGLGYVDVSTDPKRRCGACAFFTAAQTGCGTCQMLSGGPVSAGSVCNSFAPKPA